MLGALLLVTQTYWRMNLPINKYRAKLKINTGQQVQDIVDLNSITRELDKSIEKEKPDSYQLPLTIAEGVTRIFAANKNDLDRQIVNESFIRRKEEAQNEIVNWSGLSSIERLKRIENPEKYMKIHMDNLKTDIKDLPQYLQNDAVLRFQGFYGQNLLSAKKALYKEKTKALEDQLTLMESDLQSTAANNPEEAKTRKEELLALFANGQLYNGRANNAIIKGTIDYHKNADNYAGLTLLKNDKNLPPKARVYATKAINGIKEKSENNFDKQISSLNTVEDIFKLPELAVKTGDNTRKQLVTNLLDAFGNSFAPGKKTFNPEDIKKVRNIGQKLGYDETKISELIQNASERRFANSADLFERFTGKSFNDLSLKSKDQLGLGLFKESDLHEAASLIGKNPENADQIIKKLAYDNGLASRPATAWENTLQFMENNTPESNKKEYGLISIFRATKLAGYESNLTDEQLASIALQHDIPSYDKYDIDDSFKLKYGENYIDVLRAIETETAYNMFIKPGAEHSPKDEDFKDDFIEEVNKKTEGPGFFSRTIDYFLPDKPAQISKKVYDELTPRQRYFAKKTFADVENLTIQDYDNYDEESQELLNAEEAIKFSYKERDGAHGVYVKIGDEGVPVALKDKQGNKIKFSTEDAINGNTPSADKRTKLGHVWGLADSSVLKLYNTFLKDKKIKSAQDKRFVLKPFKINEYSKSLTFQEGSKTYNIKRATGETETVTLKTLIKENLRNNGLPEQFSSTIALQLMLESGRLGRSVKNFNPKVAKEVKLKSGKKVKIIGYAQMTLDKAKRFAEQGIDVTTVPGSVQAMVLHMKELMAQGWGKLSEAQKDNPKVIKALYSYALKNYNGTGYDAYKTLIKGFDRKGSTGSLENIDYVTQILGPISGLSESELTGEGKKLTFDRVQDIKMKQERAAGDAQGLAELGYDISGTTDFFKRGDTMQLRRTLDAFLK